MQIDYTGFCLENIPASAQPTLEYFPNKNYIRMNVLQRGFDGLFYILKYVQDYFPNSSRADLAFLQKISLWWEKYNAFPHWNASSNVQIRNSRIKKHYFVQHDLIHFSSARATPVTTKEVVSNWQRIDNDLIITTFIHLSTLHKYRNC